MTLSVARGTVYAGSMAPFEAPLVIQVSHKRITRVVTAYDTNSFFYAGVIKSSKLRKVKIDGKGRFHFTVKTSLIDDPNIFWNDERYPDQLVQAFKGKLGKRSAVGTVRATVRFLDGSTATSGSQRFHLAHKTGRVFGGVTSESMPVTVELNSAGTRVNHLHVAWAAPATDGGVWAMADFLTNFNLTGGAFDEAFTADYPMDEGGTLSYAYHRRNDPWPASDFGPKRWATVLDICRRVHRHELFLGYASVPGEAFAETYAMMAYPELHLPWLYSDVLAADDAAEAAVRRDVLDPWTGPESSTIRGRLAAGRTRKLTFAFPLDGTGRLTVTGRGRYALALTARGHTLRRARPHGHVTRLKFTVCGSRHLGVRLRAVRGGGAFTLELSRP